MMHGETIQQKRNQVPSCNIRKMEWPWRMQLKILKIIIIKVNIISRNENSLKIEYKARKFDYVLFFTRQKDENSSRPSICINIHKQQLKRK